MASVLKARVGRGWGHGDGRARRVRVWVSGRSQVPEAPSVVRRLGPSRNRKAYCGFPACFARTTASKSAPLRARELRELLDDAPLLRIRRRGRRRRPRVPTRRHGRETPASCVRACARREGGAEISRMRPTAPIRKHFATAGCSTRETGGSADVRAKSRVCS